MKTLIFSIALLFGLSAQADMIKPVTLNMLCEDADGEYKINILSDANGSTVTINDEQPVADAQLIAGTEGSAPYIQTVNNAAGYNIFISGTDLNNAFADDLTNNEATLNAYVNLFNISKEFKATCKGLLAF